MGHTLKAFLHPLFTVYLQVPVAHPVPVAVPKPVPVVVPQPVLVKEQVPVLVKGYGLGHY